MKESHIIETRFGEFYLGEIVQFLIFPLGKVYGTVMAGGILAIGEQAKLLAEDEVQLFWKWDEIPAVLKTDIHLLPEPDNL